MRADAQAADGNELRGLIRRLAVHVRVHHECSFRRDEQRVAVGGGPGDELGTDAGARAGLVLDHNRLRPRQGEPLRHATCDHIGRAPAG